MLEFLVLGQIPGTHIQITFAWYLFLAFGLLSFILHKIRKPHHNITPKETNQLKLFN